MTDPPPDLEQIRAGAAQARRAIDTLRRTGGIATRADLQRHWGLTASTVRDYTRHPDFPAPINATAIAAGESKSPVWSIAEADLWRHTPRRPGPAPSKNAGT